MKRELKKKSNDKSKTTGDLSGVSGDLDKCEITDDDRAKGINIEDLIQSDGEQSK